jgi:hypothetical protein
MSFDPQKFFIDLMDFFSILLPGALLTFILMGDAGSVVLGLRASELVGPEGWAAFLFVSYLLGHLVFLLGSWLDEFYDWARRYTLNTQIELLARRNRLLPRPARALIWLVFRGERNLAVNRAVRIKQQALRSLRAEDSMNTFHLPLAPGTNLHLHRHRRRNSASSGILHNRELLRPGSHRCLRTDGLSSSSTRQPLPERRMRRSPAAQNRRHLERIGTQRAPHCRSGLNRPARRRHISVS